MGTAGSVGRWWLACVLTRLLIPGSGVSQDPQVVDQFDLLLEALDPPSAGELIESLGPVPSLAELLVPLPGDFVPMTERAIAGASDPRIGELDAELDSEPDASIAAGLAWDLAELTEETLGADHPALARARGRARELEALGLLGKEDRERRNELKVETAGAIDAYNRGRLDEALERAMEVACIEYELMGTAGQLASPLGTVAVCLYERGDYARGERAARAALQQSIEEVGIWDRKVATALNNLASLSTIMRRLDVARKLHAHSLAVRRELFGDQVGAFAQALLQLAGLFRLSEDHESAAQVVDRAIAILEATGEMPDRLGTLLKERSVLEWLSGEDDQARMSLLRSIELLRSVYPGDHPSIADAIGTLADVERERGSFEQSLKLAREAYAMERRLHGPSNPKLGTPLHRLANSLGVMGDLAGAEQAYREALDGMTSASEGHTEERAMVLLSLSELLRARGDPAGAQEMSDRATLEQRGQLGRSRLFAGVLRRQARRKSLAGDLNGALADLEEALAICRERLEPDHPRLVELNVARAALYLEQGNLEAAEELLEVALRSEAELQGGAREIRADACQLSGQLAFLRGQLEPAARFIGTALYLRQDLFGAPHPHLVESLFLAGEIAEAQGKEQASVDAYSEALAQASALRIRIAGDERDRAVFAGRLSIGKIARKLVMAHLDLGQFDAAFDAAEQGRERALLDLVTRSGTDLIALARESGAIGVDRLEGQLGECRRAEKSLRLVEMQLRAASSRATNTVEDLEQFESEMQDAQRALLAAEGQLESSLREVWPSATPLSAEAVAAELGPQEGLLHFTVDDQGMALVAVRGGPEVAWHGELLAHGEEGVRRLQGRILQWIAAVRAGEAVDEELRQSISDRLIPPQVWELLAGCERVVLVPDGTLNELPFECLNTPLGPWVQRGPHVVYSPSATLFARGRRNPRVAPEGTPRALILGNPAFAQDNLERAVDTEWASSTLDSGVLRAHFDRRLTPLPGSEVEARRIAQTLGDAQWRVETLIGPRAVGRALHAAAPGASLVHLATHGFAARSERPYESALALSLPEGSETPGAAYLSLDDLIRNWGGRLNGCDLVVLSACDTQVGVILGESRVALSWGFFFAGADSVLVSLWKVDDRATTLLMDRFYTNYVGAFDSERRAGSVLFPAGQAMNEAAALLEAKAWLASSPPEQNKLRLEEIGFDEREAGLQSPDRGQFPRPSSGPTARPILQAYDFRAPRYGSAFVLYGQPD